MDTNTLLIIIAVELAIIGFSIVSELQKIHGIARYFFDQDYDNKHPDSIL